MRPFALPVALVVSAACAPVLEAPTEPTEPVAATTPRCRRPVERGVLVRQERDTCPWLVVGDGHRVWTGTLDPAPADVSRGSWPGDCPSPGCRVEVASTIHGPVLWASSPGIDSEVPRGLWLGVRSSGGALIWLDLWSGAPEDRIDHSAAGPSHGLTAQICAEGVQLEVKPRLPGADAVESPAAMEARAGTYVWRDDALERVDAELRSCEAVRAP